MNTRAREQRLSSKRNDCARAHQIVAQLDCKACWNRFTCERVHGALWRKEQSMYEAP